MRSQSRNGQTWRLSPATQLSLETHLVRAEVPGGISGQQEALPHPRTVCLPLAHGLNTLHSRKPRLFKTLTLDHMFCALCWPGWVVSPAPPSRQEVVSHCKKLTKKNKEQLSDMMVLDKQKGLKSLSKEKRQKLEAYQHLFYLLQVSRGLWEETSLFSPEGLGPEAFMSKPSPAYQESFPAILTSCTQGKRLPPFICLECS